MTYYFLSLLAAIGCAGNFSLTKLYQKRVGENFRERLLFLFFVGLFSSALFFVLCGFRFSATPFSLGIALLFQLFVSGYTFIGFRLMTLGSMTVYTVFVMLGGAVVPYVYGLVFLHEPISVPKVLALLLVVAAMLLTLGGQKRRKQSFVFIALCLLVFFLNGGASVVSKMHQIETVYPTVSPKAFVLLSNLLRCLIFAVALLFCRTGIAQRARAPIPKTMYLLILSSSAISGFSYMLQLMAASYMPATVLYPLVTGGTILFSALFDRLCFGQRLSLQTSLSVILCLLSLFLFAL